MDGWLIVCCKENVVVFLYFFLILICLLTVSRTFVMPSRMCINPIHNEKAIFHRSDDGNTEER